MRAALDPRDKRLLLACGGLITLLVVLLAVFSSDKEDDDPTPSSYSTAPHGARAAYQLLQQAGYRVERQTDSLAELDGAAGSHIDEHTTVIFAEPFLPNVSDSKQAVKAILDRGGRVLVTGFSGGLLLPENAVQSNGVAAMECDATPKGTGDLTGSGTVHLTLKARWKPGNPLQQVAYTCQGDAVAVTYRSGKGTAVWWADSLPLENAGIQRKDNLVLFLNSVGSPATTRVLWDESLHGAPPSLMSYTHGTPLKWIGWQLVLIAALLLWSYARRSGPLRPDPAMPRTAQIEFVYSLGSLYQAANATQTAVSDAFQQFRLKMEQLFAISPSLPASSTSMASALTRYFGPQAEGVQQAMVECEEAIAMEKLPARVALLRIQALYDCMRGERGR
jgi:Domain of unknown function (DUF4350)